MSMPESPTYSTSALGVGLHGHILFLSLYSRPWNLREEMADKNLHGLLVFVGCDGHFYAALCQLLEHFRNAGVGLRVVGHMLGIIAFEERAHRLYAFGRACRFGQNALKQFGYAASYEFRICRERMCGKAGFRKGIVRCLAEVGYGVEKSAVEVEDYERFHVS